MTRRKWQVKPKISCPHCQSLVWDLCEWSKDFFPRGISRCHHNTPFLITFL